MEVFELIERGERIGDRIRAHAGLAQDRFGKDRLRTIVLYDEHAERIGIFRVEQFGYALHHVARLRGQRNETVGAGAHRAQTDRQFGRMREREQAQSTGQPRARDLDHVADGFQRILERCIDDDQMRAKRAEHFLQFGHAVDQGEFVARRFDFLIDFTRSGLPSLRWNTLRRSPASARNGGGSFGIGAAAAAPMMGAIVGARSDRRGFGHRFRRNGRGPLRHFA